MQITDQLPSGSDVRPSRVDWDRAKSLATANPGKWVMIAENIASSIPDQLRKGANKRFRGDELRRFEFATRRPKDAPYPKRRTDLWARFTPEGFVKAEEAAK